METADRGRRLYALCCDLFPILRSLTGEGVRATLRRLRDVCGLEVCSLPSGAPILDWTAPLEWNVEAARLRDPDGATLADIHVHNLHLVGYSVAHQGSPDLDELRPHLYGLPDRPDWVPYRTSYWRQTWGFCLPQRTIDALRPGRYEVVIDADLSPGEMNWGELVVPGRRSGEILISTHICHPSMANDNCSGMAVAAELAAEFARGPRPGCTLRFLFAPGTVGAIAWLATHRDQVPSIRHAVVLAGLGDPGGLTLKHTRRGGLPIDAAAVRVARRTGRSLREEPFAPYGYDERQYSSPGFDLPAIVVSRTPFGRCPEYHTSADNLAFIRPDSLADSFDYLFNLIGELAEARHPVNLSPFGEPQLGRRGLYDALGGASHARELQTAMLWILNLADGRADDAWIRERSGLPGPLYDAAMRRLREAGLIAWEDNGS